MIRRVVIPALLCLIFMLGFVSSVWAGSSTSVSEDGSEEIYSKAMKQFDQTAERLYRAAKESNRQEGYLHIQRLRSMMSGPLTGAPGSRDGWRIIERSAEEVETAVAGGKPGADWLTGAARIRLASDSLLRPEAPLWHSYETVLRDDLDRVVKAWSRTDGNGAKSARAAMDSLVGHFDRIEAAARLQLEPVKVDEVKGKIAYAIELLDAGNNDYAYPEWTDKAFIELGGALSRLFEGTAAAEPLPAVAPIHAGNPISWVLLLGTVITGVLTYVGYRKYKQQPYGVKPFQ